VGGEADLCERNPEPPKPPKPLSQNEIIKRKNEGFPLTTEELEIYETWRQKRTDQHQVWRHRIKANEPHCLKTKYVIIHFKAKA
jgi:hypothetical protein